MEISKEGELNALKKDFFLRLMEITGRVFVFVEHSADVIIGKRGFTEEEKRRGLVLIINSSMNYTLDDDGLSVRLVFGTRAEECYVPLKNVFSVYSPELETQILTPPSLLDSAQTTKKTPSKSVLVKAAAKDTGNKIIEVDFKKNKE